MSVAFCVMFEKMVKFLKSITFFPSFSKFLFVLHFPPKLKSTGPFVFGLLSTLSTLQISSFAVVVDTLARSLQVPVLPYRPAENLPGGDRRHVTAQTRLAEMHWWRRIERRAETAGDRNQPRVRHRVSGSVR